MTHFVIAVLAVSGVACGKRASEPAGGSGTGVSAGSGSGSLVGSSGSAASEPPVDDNPTPPVVQTAFGGHVPAFPQLSKDGRTAAVALDAQLDLTSVTTYAVGFVGTSGALAVTTLVDARLAKVLLEGGADGKPAKIDTAAVATAASAVTKRLHDEGFSAFEKTVEELAPGEPVATGLAKLQLAESDDATLTITVLDGRGKQVAKDAIKPVAMGRVVDLECVSQPVPRHAWFDTPRKRVLVEVGWNSGPDQCNAPDTAYRLYAVP